MRRTTALGLCLTVAVIGSALASTQALALPEFTGPFPNTFTSTSGKTTLETVKKVKLTCASDTGSGELTGGQTGTMQILFSGCSLKSVPCNTPGIVPGSIFTGTLVMKIGYINKATKEVGVDLATATGGPMMEFICGPTRGVVIGSVIGAITPVNKLIKAPKAFKLKFAQKKGIQAIPALEGQPPDTPEASFGGPFEPAGLKSTDTLTFSAPVLLQA